MKPVLNKSLSIILASVLSSTTFAANDVINTTTVNSVEQNTQIANSKSDNGAMWNLSESEWNEYKKLMQGPAGYYYKDFTPPEVLGYSATNEIEMRHYAEIYVKQEHTKVERELMFSKIFTETAKRLYPQEPIIKPFDVSPYTPIPNNFFEKNEKNEKNEKIIVQSGDHLILLVDLKLFSDKNLLDKLVSNSKENNALFDIYFLNADDEAIQKWARANQISVDDVANNRITLNKEQGKFKELIKEHTDLPIMLLVHDNKTKVFNAGDL